MKIFIDKSDTWRGGPGVIIHGIVSGGRLHPPLDLDRDVAVALCNALAESLGAALIDDKRAEPDEIREMLEAGTKSLHAHLRGKPKTGYMSAAPVNDAMKALGDV